VQVDFLDLNLLPEQRPKRRGVTPSGWLGWLLVAFAVATLIPLWQLQRSGNQRVQELQRTLGFVRSQVRRADDLLAERDMLQRSLRETTDQIEQLERQRSILEANQSNVTAELTAVLDALPPRARLESLAREGKTIKIEGSAGSASLVLDYARSLQELGLFRRVNVISLDRKKDDPLPTAVTFVIEIEER